MDKDDYQRKRNKVLDNTLLLEYIINEMLAGVLSIREAEKSLSLGSQNSALSLNNKVNLLIDLGAISQDSQTKFQHFMSIRNKFLHLRQITSFVLCYQCIGKSLINYLEKSYPSYPDHSIEENYERQYSLLSADVIDIAAYIQKSINEKMAEKIIFQSNNNLLSTLRQTISNELDFLEAELKKYTRHSKIEKFTERIRTIIDQLKPLP